MVLAIPCDLFTSYYFPLFFTSSGAPRAACAGSLIRSHSDRTRTRPSYRWFNRCCLRCTPTRRGRPARVPRPAGVRDSHRRGALTSTYYYYICVWGVCRGHLSPHFSALCHPAHAVRVDRMLIGAYNPMLCPIRVFNRTAMGGCYGWLL